jgi:hypothetical protein
MFKLTEQTANSLDYINPILKELVLSASKLTDERFGIPFAGGKQSLRTAIPTPLGSPIDYYHLNGLAVDLVPRQERDFVTDNDEAFDRLNAVIMEAWNQLECKGGYKLVWQGDCSHFGAKAHYELHPDIDKRTEDQKTTESAILQNKALLRNYGITLDFFRLKLKEQKNKCPICQETLIVLESEILGLKNYRKELSSEFVIDMPLNRNYNRQFKGIVCKDCYRLINSYDRNSDLLLNASIYCEKPKPTKTKTKN